MSKQDCVEFFTRINTDTALQQEVGAALEAVAFRAALEGKEETAAASALAEIGEKHGYHFTIEEAAQKHQEIIAAADGEQIPGTRPKNSCES